MLRGRPPCGVYHLPSIAPSIQLTARPVLLTFYRSITFSKDHCGLALPVLFAVNPILCNRYIPTEVTSTHRGLALPMPLTVNPILHTLYPIDVRLSVAQTPLFTILYAHRRLTDSFLTLPSSSSCPKGTHKSDHIGGRDDMSRHIRDAYDAWEQLPALKKQLDEQATRC